MDSADVSGIICASGCLILCIAWSAAAIIRAIKNVPEDPYDQV